MPTIHVPEAMVPVWDENASKYHIFCGLFHIRKVTLFVGYLQLFTTLIIVALFTYFFYLYKNELTLEDYAWFRTHSLDFILMVFIAIGLQLLIILMLIHGAKNARRSYLIPFLMCTLIGAFVHLIGLIYDYDQNQFATHIMGILVHLFFARIVWLCYNFLTDQEMAKVLQIHTATHGILKYDYLPNEIVSAPPSYADILVENDKQPLKA